MKNVKQGTTSQGLSKRLMAFLLAFTMVLGLCPAVFADDSQAVADNLKIEVTSGGQTVTANDSIPVGKEFAIRASGSIVQNDSAVDLVEIRLYIGEMGLEAITDINGGGKTPGLSTDMDKYRCTVKNDNDGKGNYILIEHIEKINGVTTVLPWKAGDTFGLSFKAKFDYSASSNHNWNLTLEGTGGNPFSTTVKPADPTVVMNNTKTVNSPVVNTNNATGEDTLNKDITYTLSAYTGEKESTNPNPSVGEAIVTSYTVTDSLSLTNGLYIEASADDQTSLYAAAKAALGNPEDLVITGVTNDGIKITGFSFSYTVNNSNAASNLQAPNFSKTIALKKECVKVPSNYVSGTGEINNAVSTTYQTRNNTTPMTTDSKTVTTTVNRPAPESLSQTSKKMITALNKDGVVDNNNIVVGDYVLYELYCKYDGESQVTDVTVTDTLPEGLTLVSSADSADFMEAFINALKNVEQAQCWDSTWASKNDDERKAIVTQKAQSGAWAGYWTNPTITTNGNTITFNVGTMAKDATFNGYVLAKITSDVDEDTERVNTANFKGTTETSTFTQKELKPELSIVKKAYDTYGNEKTQYSAGDTVTYKITVSNTGNAAAENVVINDTFRDALFENISSSINVTGATITRKAASDGDSSVLAEYTSSAVTIPAGGSVELTVTGKIKETTKKDKISNTADYTYNNETKDASWDLIRIQPSSQVTVTKVNDKSGNKVAVGEEITYTIHVSMNGQTFTADEPLVLTDSLNYGNSGLEFISTTWNAGNDNVAYTQNGKTITYTITGSNDVDITVKAKVESNAYDNQVLKNQVKVQNGPTAEDPGVTVNKPEAKVGISKTNDKNGETVKAGDEITYTINVNLNGQTFTADKPLVITDRPGYGLTYKANSSTTSGNSNVTTTENADGTVTYRVTGSDNLVITVVCTVNEGVYEGSVLKNKASIEGGNSVEDPGVQFHTPVEAQEGLTITKYAEVYRGDSTTPVATITPDQPGKVQAGDTLKFYIKITNTGTQDRTDITFYDKLTGNYEFPKSNDAYKALKGDSSLSSAQTEYNVDDISVMTKYDYGNTWNSDKGANYFPANETWGQFRLRSTEEYTDNEWWDANFVLKPNEYITLTYSVVADVASVFEGGSNSVKLGDTDTPVTITYEPDTPPTAAPTEEPTEAPTAAPGETAAPTTAPQPDNMAKLEIKKWASDNWEGKTEVNDFKLDSLSTLTSNGNAPGELYYCVEIKNTSQVTYETTNAALIDYLPPEYGIKTSNSGSSVYYFTPPWNTCHTCNYTGEPLLVNGSEEVCLATLTENDDYKDKTKWSGYIAENASHPASEWNALPQNVVSIMLFNQESNGTYSLKLEPNQSIKIIYVLKAKKTTLSNINDQVDAYKTATGNQNLFYFDELKLHNTAYFTGDTQFKNSSDTPTRVIAATNDVTVRAEAVNPGVKKTAFASFNVHETQVKEGSSGVSNTAYLIWKLCVRNDGQEDMTDYALTDVLPYGCDYLAGNTVTNTANTTFPEVLANSYTDGANEPFAGDFANGEIIKYNSSGEVVDRLDYFAPTTGTTTLEDGTTTGTLLWNFGAPGNGVDYTLKPGERLEFLIITDPTENKSGVYYNQAVLKVNDKYYEDTVNVGTVDGDKITDGDSFSINTVLTSSYIAVDTSKTDGYVKGSDNPNIAEEDAGKTVTYKMVVKNEDSDSSIKNISFINRLPYEGDSGVIVSGGSTSDYAVKYKNNMQIQIYDVNGPVGDPLTDSQYVVTTYSADDAKKFTADSDEWDSGVGNGWVSGYDDSTKLVRIQIDETKTLAPGQWIEITYNAELPPSAADEDQIAWNRFAYHYDSANGDYTNMASEPAAVGVKLPKNETAMGSIRIKKVWTGSTAKTFYFAVYNAPYKEDGTGGQKVSNVYQIALGAASLKKPVNAEVTIENLPYTTIGGNVNYYIYETDENGVPLTQSDSLGYTMCAGFYRPDKAQNYVYLEGTPTDEYDGRNDPNTTNPTANSGTDSNGKVQNEIIKANNGDYGAWMKGLSVNQKSNSAIFSNLVPEQSSAPTVTMMGTYYSDIASTENLADEDRLYTGKTTFNESESWDTATVQDYGKKYNAQGNAEGWTEGRFIQTYDGNKLVNERNGWIFGDGFGNNQGHTVSTGFLAHITGGAGTTITSATWKIKSQPQLSFGAAGTSHDVYVRLSDAKAEGETSTEKDKFEAAIGRVGYKLDKSGTVEATFTDDQGKDERGYNSGIYRVVYDEDFGKTSSENYAVDMSTGKSTEENRVLAVGEENEPNSSTNGLDNEITFDQDPDDILNITEDDAAMLAEAEPADGSEDTTRALSWTIKEDNFPQMTLTDTANVYIGVILDQIYDREAHATLLLNDTADTNVTSAKATEDVGNAPQVNVANPNTNVLTMLQSGKPYSISLGPFNIGTYEEGEDDNKKTYAEVGTYKNESGNFMYKVTKEKMTTNPSASDITVAGSLESGALIGFKIPSGGTIKIEAKSGSNTQARAIVLYDENGNLISCNEYTEAVVDETSEEGTITLDNETYTVGRTADDKNWCFTKDSTEYTIARVNAPGLFYIGKVEKSVTVPNGGMIYIGTTSSNVKISKITFTATSK